MVRDFEWILHYGLSGIAKDIQIRHVERTTNDYGDVTETWTSTDTKAEIQVMDGSESIVRHGILQVGDAIGFFRAQDTIEIGDYVWYAGKLYKVYNVFPEIIDGLKIFTEAHLKPKLD